MANIVVKATWVHDPVAVWVPGYARWAKMVHSAIGDVIQARQDEIEEWMKENAPWQDITGVARDSLHTAFEEMLFGYILRFLYAAPLKYWVYLEYDHQGRFAILEPAVNFWGPIILDDIQAILQ